MKGKLHIPTEQYGYIELEQEGQPADFVKLYRHTKQLLETEDLSGIKQGLNDREYAEVRRTLLITNEYDVNLEDKMNAQQLRWVKDTNNTIRDIKRNHEI